MLAGSQVPPTLVRGVTGRPEEFALPFVASLPSPEGRGHTRTSLSGPLADLEPKNAEAIASRHDLDRQVIPRGVGEVARGHDPLIQELDPQVARAIGRPDAVLVSDPSAFPTKGTASVGVQRQWWGRLAKLESSQVGIFLGYLGDQEHALVAFRLYPPRESATDRKRRTKAGVPNGVNYRTRHQLAPEMLQRRGGVLPHGGAAGAHELGRPAWVRPRLPPDGGRYLLAVPSSTTARDLGEPPPPYRGHGRRPEAPSRRGPAWCAPRPAGAWTRLTGPDGERGPLEVEVVARRVESEIDRRVVGSEETPVVVRPTAGGGLKPDYHRSNAAPGTPLAEFARLARAGRRIERCLKRSQSEAGLGEYRVRNWRRWHHHRARSLIATWFLVVEARRGKRGGPGAERTAGADGPGADPAPGQRPRRAAPSRAVWHARGRAGWSGTSRRGSTTTRRVINWHH